MKALHRIVACTAASAALAVPSLASLTNVALGRAVTSAGSVGSGSAALSTLTDGVFRPRSTHWQSGTVWWTGTSTTFTIDLGAAYELAGGIVQADDNDAYTMEYRDAGTGTWSLLWAVPNYGSFGNGMQTRPNPSDNSAIFLFTQPVMADAIRIGATPGGGDNSNSLAEVQVYAVPAPGAVAMVAMIGALGGRRRARGRSGLQGAQA